MMFDPTPELPANTLITTIRFPTIVRNALILAGLTTVGDFRALPDRDLRMLRRVGPGRLSYLRKKLGRCFIGRNIIPGRTRVRSIFASTVTVLQPGHYP